MNTEQFIADSARRGLSKTQVRETLGLCRETFYAMLEAMPPLPWPARGQSLGHKLGNEAKRGHCSPALRAALKQAVSTRKALHSHTVDGRHGTIDELVEHYSVSASTVRRRIKSGMSIEQALKTPPTPFSLRRDGFGTSARPGMEVAS